MTDLAMLLLEVPRALLRVVVVVLGVHFIRAALGMWRSHPEERPADPDPWPFVTVQLPIRDEFYVVERILRAACALEYPRDRFEIQVLDDSTDATRERTRALVDGLQHDGQPIVLVQRPTATGYKAGALEAGMATARGELVAVFDADCSPRPDFLRQTVPWFHDPSVGCVQVRWSFHNRTRSLLSRLQAMVLDGLFAVDQTTRVATGLPLQFNGTNGILRRTFIEDAGGWASDTLTEDADLSFRAQLRGWRVVHRRDYDVPTEIPEDLAAFRAQQRRWALGSAQILRVRGFEILRARIPLRSKLMMFMHLGRHSIDPLIVLVCLTSPLTALYGLPFLVEYTTSVNAALVGFVALSCFVFYGVANRAVRAPLWELALIPLIILLAIGMSVVYTVAFVHGLLRRGGAFVRTPKAGDRERARGPVYRSPFDPLTFVEVSVGVSHLWFALKAARAGYGLYAAFFGAVALSFLWVGMGSMFRRRMGNEESNGVAVDVASSGSGAEAGDPDALLVKPAVDYPPPPR